MILTIQNGKVMADGVDISDAFSDITIEVTAKLLLIKGNSINIQTAPSQPVDFDIEKESELRFKRELSFKHIARISAHRSQ